MSKGIGLNNKLNEIRFQDQDYNRLGGEVLAATYALKLGGRCLIQGSSRWLSSKDQSLLPKTRMNDFRVEGIDLSRTVIKENGISNFGKFLFALIATSTTNNIKIS